MTDEVLNEPVTEPVTRLTRDMRNAAKLMTHQQARYLVDAFYAHQEDRIRAAHQQRTLALAEEPHEVVTWVQSSEAAIERGIKNALGVYAAAHPVGQWSLQITGIGPILAAGLLAHIDMNPWRCARTHDTPFFDEKAKPCSPKEPHGPECHRERLFSAGHIWRFAGLDPTVRWEKKTKRPWNARLKLLTWKIGESFVKVSGKESDFYGKLYLSRKAYEHDRNEKGELASEAARALSEKKYRDDTKAKAAYLKGRLPDGHLHARAKRWTVKLFLSHWHAVAYEVTFKEAPPKPYILTKEGGHAHEISVPYWPMET